MASLAERVRRLSPEKQELLWRSLTRRRNERVSPRVPPRNGTLAGKAGLSFAQERLWFIAQLVPESSAYNTTLALRLRGSLDRVALEQSVNETVRRQAVLRTKFPSCEGSPVAEVVDAPLRRLEFTELPSRSKPLERTVHELIDDAGRRPFRLECEAPFRVELTRIGCDDHVLVIALHHIVSDAQSLQILWSEIAALYTLYTGTIDRPGEPPRRQYVELAQRDRASLSPEAARAQLDFWREQLSGAEELELPEDRPRPPSLLQRGAVHRFTLERRQLDSLERLGDQEGATLFMVLMASFQALLYRYTGQTDISVGTAVSRRLTRDAERLVGLFLNLLVLRSDLSGNPDFREFLRRVRDTALAAYEHADVPFEQVVSTLPSRRDFSQNPLFRAMLILNPPAQNFELGELSVEILDPPKPETVPFDLTLSLTPAEDGLYGAFEYSRELFDKATIAALAASFSVLVDTVVTASRTPLSELPLVNEEERAALFALGRGAERTEAGERSAVERFEAVVVREAERTALTGVGVSISFAELNCRANQLACVLSRSGVRRGVFVGVCLPRGTDATVAALATLKAGGVYVPLDPEYPAARLRFLVEDSGARAVVTLEGFEHHLAGPDLKCVIRLDGDRDEIARASVENPPLANTIDDPAYVVYTSGSTGQPKGVAISHRQLRNRLHWFWEEYPFGPDEVVGQRAPLSFVDSVWEMLVGLLDGVPTAVFSEEEVKDSHGFVRALNRSGVTRLLVLPSLLKALLEVVPDLGERLPRLRFWITSSEPLSTGLWSRFRRSAPKATLYNLYSSSEAGDVAWYAPDSRTEKLLRVPIGRPIGNLQLYILDRSLQPVPRGIPGELFVGGVGIPREYWRRPDLSGKRFLANPFDDGWGDFLYATGDRARFLDDGNVDLLGRTDHQVKMRGFRVELEEVEAAFLEDPGVSEAVVTAAEAGEESELSLRLTAHVVPARASGVDPTQLLVRLARKLPGYMVPAFVKTWDHLPLSANGKLDRARLASEAPDRLSTRASADSCMAARTERERELVALWEEFLGISPVGIRDNFFALGGHSLLAVRLFNAIERRCGQRLPLATLAHAQTVEALAEVLDRPQIQASGESCVVPLRTVGSRAPLFLVHADNGRAASFHELAAHLPEDRPCYGLEASGGSHLEAPLERVEELAGLYVSALKKVEPSGPYVLGGLCVGRSIAFEMVRQLEARGDRVVLLLQIGSARPPGRAAEEARRLRRKRIVEILQGSSLVDCLRRGAVKLVRGLRRVRNERRFRAAIAGTPLADVLAANQRAKKRYEPVCGIHCPVAFFLPAARFRAQRGGRVDPKWHSLAPGPFEWHVAGDDPNAMLVPPDVTELASAITICIERVEGRILA